MFKRFSANYSLWPERALPRRRHTANACCRALAVGGVCAIAAYNLISNFVGSATVQEPTAQRVVEHVLTFAPAAAPAATPTPALLETVNRRNGTRGRAAKVTLPIIGSQAALPSAATDGRGGDELAVGASVAALAASSGNAPSLIDGEPALQPPAQEAGADEANLAAATEGPVKLRKKIVRKKRERPTRYAARYHKERERPTRYAAGRYLQGPISIGLVTPTASWY